MGDSWTGRIGNSLLGLFVPESCASCGGAARKGQGGRLCATCLAAVPRLREPWCNLCGLPGADGGVVIPGARCGRCGVERSIHTARAYGSFDGLLRELLRRLKYSGDRKLAEPLGGLLLEAGTEHLTLQDYDVIVPVPLHRDRLRERGFNQAFLLSRPLASAARLPVVPALERLVNATAQVGLKGDARRGNVEGVFTVHPRRTSDVVRRTVLLVDDVLTTGATADACARALLKAGSKRVDVLTVARTP